MVLIIKIIYGDIFEIDFVALIKNYTILASLIT